MDAGREPLDVLFVGWDPGADDPITGRFIAERAGRNNEAVHRERTLLASLKGISRPVELVHGNVGYPEGAAAGPRAGSRRFEDEGP